VGLEAARIDWKAQHVPAVLGISRATIYNTPSLLRSCHQIGKRGRRWSPREVRAAQAIASSNRRS
jgi:predicted DNA-binding transcriptional regulator AlpA